MEARTPCPAIAVAVTERAGSAFGQLIAAKSMAPSMISFHLEF